MDKIYGLTDKEVINSRNKNGSNNITNNNTRK